MIKYPENSVIDLLDSEMMTDATKYILRERLSVPFKNLPDFFQLHDFQLLIAVSDRLLPQESSRKIDLAGMLDTALFEGTGNGWRYDQLPPDAESFKKGIGGIEETAIALFGKSFLLLTTTEQDDVLFQIQKGDPPGTAWQNMPAALFFEELLVGLTELYYAHPYGREEIGDLSVADKPGWTNIGLNQLEAREPPAS